MGEFAIEVQNLSKIYNIYEKPVDRLKEVVSFSKKQYHREFYALRDVDFKVQKGKTVGIIGKNGAGKSTLLKIITGVLTPTTGKVIVNGRIASLLELGAGFNPEFTGYENIYLNGTVMGLSKAEIDEKIAAIIEFADIGDFLYQPVKSYSSGMFVRLAFSVSINVQPDVLIVDEALSVGDAEFTLKCLKKINALKESGMTILLVTHGIEMLKSFADEAILMVTGSIVSRGNPVDVGLEYYRILFGDDKNMEKSVGNPSNEQLEQERSVVENERGYIYTVYPDEKKKYGNGSSDITKIEVFGLTEPNFFYGGKEITIRVHYKFWPDEIRNIILQKEVCNNMLFGIRIENAKGVVLTDLASAIKNDFSEIHCTEDLKHVVLDFSFKTPNLEPGLYWFSPEIAVGIQDALAPLVEYTYLFNLNCISKEKVLGMIRFDYDIKNISEVCEG